MEQTSAYPASETSLVPTELDAPCWQYDQRQINARLSQGVVTEQVREGKAQISITLPVACPSHNETPFRGFCLEILLGLLFVIVLCLFAL